MWSEVRASVHAIRQRARGHSPGGWRRSASPVREGVLLLATQPYASGSVHHPPLALAFWRAVWEAAQQADIPWQAATLAVATLSDAMLACLVYRICKLCLRQEARPQLEAWAARLPVPAVTAQLFARDRLPFTLATLCVTLHAAPSRPPLCSIADAGVCARRCWLHPALITASAAMSTASFEALWPLAALLLAGLGAWDTREHAPACISARACSTAPLTPQHAEQVGLGGRARCWRQRRTSTR